MSTEPAPAHIGDGLLAAASAHADPADENGASREALSAIRGLLVLSQLLTETGDEHQAIQLAVTAVPGLARCHTAGVILSDDTWVGDPRRDHEVAAAVRGLDSAGGQLQLAGTVWAWAYPLRSLQDDLGFLVVAADAEPLEHEQFLLRALAQHTGGAINNARLHSQERAAAKEVAEVNARLQKTVGALRRSMDIHERLTHVAASGAGREGLAEALHEVTGYPIAIEDGYGNLQAWAGPSQPDPYPKDAPACRERLLHNALREGRPVRDGSRYVAVARPSADLMGVIVLVDSAGTADEQELMALEQGTTVLAMELARLRSLAETELRIRRDLIHELLAGTDEASALRRAQALGYDLQRPHRVVVVDGEPLTDDSEVFLHAVRRAARDEPVGSLVAFRGELVVILADHEASWASFRQRVLAEMGGGRCRVGVGSRYERIEDIPRSYQQAQFTVRLQHHAGWPEQATAFERLGVYQLLARSEHPEEVEHFIQRWLEPLRRYDVAKNSNLVETLRCYLECGGSYDDTAQALFVHRSTLKYRLQRIREIGDLDLKDPDTRFNLQMATRALDALTAGQQGAEVGPTEARPLPLSSSSG